ncbi:4Fe-4S ferredoxin [Spirochaetia bacterium]|nr:4Fe-4S ferredoxin [Spirochaetia bacterium]
MKKLAVQNPETCMYCLTCENACVQAFYKGESNQAVFNKGANTPAQELTCIHVGPSKNDPSKIKITTCVQCGKCAESCEAKAITANAQGVFTINKKLCVDCGKCVEACPFHVLVKAKDKPTPSKCIACGICVKACPQDVLYIKEDAKATA